MSPWRSRRSLLRAGGITIAVSLSGCLGGFRPSDVLDPDEPADDENETNSDPADDDGADDSDDTNDADDTNNGDDTDDTDDGDGEDDANGITDPDEREWVTRELGEPFTTGEDYSITVTEVHTMVSLLYLDRPDTWDVLSTGNHQFVFATIETDEGSGLVPDPDEFEFRVDDDSFDGRDSVGDAGLDFALAQPYEEIHPTPEREHKYGSVAFVLPIDVETESATIAWVLDEEREVRWVLDEDFVAALTSPAVFELEEIEIPERIVREESFEVSVTVANDGGRDEKFAATFGPSNARHPSAFRLFVPAGESETWTGEFEFPPEDEDEESYEDVEEITYRLDWGIDSIERAVTVEEPEDDE